MRGLVYLFRYLRRARLSQARLFSGFCLSIIKLFNIKQMLHYPLTSYTISSDHELLDKENHISFEVRKILEGIQPDVLKGFHHWNELYILVFP